ncbi:ribosome biogenesis protein ytm1 [Dimargaris verticillata]|uniref:Ribosome biogenesis protein YTM1 n=1 Tax=Dimargaris verticillata TaxID=2761393 RepID=A0A9W8EC62_9FUNG|nr:ribosome biogenesis protein ytm1 [Dimargaris verticillata]
MAIDSQHIQVRLVTSHSAYQLPDKPILVPVLFRRYQLSELVNHLLVLPSPVPFAFVIDNQALAGTLSQYLKSNPEVSTENVLTLEYSEILAPPKHVVENKVDDWISQVQINPSNGLILVGSYDGTSKVFDRQGQCLHSLTSHSASIKGVAWVPTRLGHDTGFAYLTSAQDRTIVAWHFDQNYSSASSADTESRTNGTTTVAASTCSSQALFECHGHTGSIEALAVSPDHAQFASASSDGLIKLWSMRVPSDNDDEDLEDADESEFHEVANQKRRKLGGQAVPLKRALGSCVGHQGGINAVTYHPTDAKFMYSGGWDYALRVWDVEYRVNVTTKPGDRMILDMAYSPMSPLIATGNADRLIRLWDPRSSENALVRQTLSSHRAWTSSVSWSLTSSHLLASGSYDGTVRLWDIRNPTQATYTFKPAATSTSDAEGAIPPTSKGLDPKVLSVDWQGDLLASGGEDGFLRLMSTAQ